MFFSCFTFFCWNREYTGYFICIGWTWGSHLCRGFGALFCHVCNRCISVKGEWLAVSHAVWMPSFFGIAPRSGCVFFPLKTKKRVVLFYIESASLRIANFCRIFHKNDRLWWDVQIAKLLDFPSSFRGSPSLARINLGPTFEKGP